MEKVKISKITYSSIKDLRNNIFNFISKTFSNKKVVNKQTKFEIGFNSSSFRKLTSGNIGSVKLFCLLEIEKIIKNGELQSVDVDKKERHEILAIYKFMSIVEFEGENYNYWFTVRQLLNGKFIYSGHLNIKKTF